MGCKAARVSQPNASPEATRNELFQKYLKTLPVNPTCAAQIMKDFELCFKFGPSVRRFAVYVQHNCNWPFKYCSGAKH